MTDTARVDGYSVGQFEFSTVSSFSCFVDLKDNHPYPKVMAIAAVMVTDLFVGLETYVWTAWVFFAVFAGIIIIWVYTVGDFLAFYNAGLQRNHVCRPYTRLFLPVGLLRLSLAIIITSSARPTSGSPFRSSSVSPSRRDTCIKHGNLTLLLTIWTSCDTSARRTLKNASPQYPPMVVCTLSDVPGHPQVSRASATTVSDPRLTIEWAVVQTWRPASAPSIGASISLPKRAA
jgi:hypothetical protein